MKVSVPGLEIDVKVRGSTLEFSVVDQSEEITNKIRNTNLVDENTGYSLKVNRFPSIGAKTGAFYLRGSEQDKNNRIVSSSFDSSEEAQEAMFSLVSLVNKLVDDDRGGIPQNAGSTTALRMSILTREQAQLLSLTDKDLYWPNRRQWEQANPIKLQAKDGDSFVAAPEHYNEHIGQGIDVLNKAIGNVPPELENGVVNPHKVCSDDARFAVEMAKETFERAQHRGPGALVAWWRLMTALRAPDFKDADNEESVRDLDEI